MWEIISIVACIIIALYFFFDWVLGDSDGEKAYKEGEKKREEERRSRNGVSRSGWSDYGASIDRRSSVSNSMRNSLNDVKRNSNDDSFWPSIGLGGYDSPSSGHSHDSGHSFDGYGGGSGSGSGASGGYDSGSSDSGSSDSGGGDGGGGGD